MYPINFWLEKKIKMLLLFVVLGFISFDETQADRIKFTKIECNATDPEFGRIDWCILKPESRYIQSVSARYTAFQMPVDDFEIRVQAMKRLNGWRPFLYDVTVNCSSARKLNKLTRLAWKHIQNVSNIRNRFCPITQTVFEVVRVDNTYLENLLPIFPVPHGDYGVFVTIKAHGKVQLKAFGGGTVY